jgi:hypothetical protein
VASNLDGGFDYESRIAAGPVAGSAVVLANGAHSAGSTAAPGPRRAPATHNDRTTLVTDGCRTAH